VNAFVALALDAPYPLGRRVEVDRVYAEGLHEPLGHLGGRISLLVDIIVSERRPASCSSARRIATVE
jgi:hypothetical protein